MKASIVFVLFCLTMATVAFTSQGLVPSKQASINPSAIGTPTATPTTETAESLSFDDIVQHADQKNWSRTQLRTYLNTLRRQPVDGWSGTILEIDKSFGRPYLSLDIKPGDPEIDAYVYISKEDVLKVHLGQEVTFSGYIDDDWPEGKGFYALEIKGTTLLKLGNVPIPTPTPTATSTRRPTRTPTKTSTPTSADIEELSEAIRVVSNSLGTNKLGVTSNDLVGFKNPKGEGSFVYVEQTRFYGVLRYIVWLVLNESAYPLNGATKNITPSLLWPREAKDGEWEKTGFSPYSSAKEAIEILFESGNQPTMTGSSVIAPTLIPTRAPTLRATSTLSPPTSDMHPLEQMEIAFNGSYTKQQIKARIDRAMILYELPITEDNYSKAGSVLVVLRRDSNVSEMDILGCMIDSYVSDVNMSFPDIAGICSVVLQD